MLFKLLGMKSIYKETLKASSSESSQSVKLLASKSTGQGSGSDETCDDPTADVMKLMQERLPSYVVNCFVASGYDSKEAICCMSVSDVPNNSIQEIEDFVEKHCDTDAASFCNQKTLCQPKPFIFPPGHRIQIKRFVCEIQEKYKNASQNKLGQKHFLQAPCLRKAKKVCCRFASASDLSSIEIDNETVSSISNQVRRGISAWVKMQSDVKLQGLKENQHFQISVQICKISDKILVTMKCMPCSTTLQLQRNPRNPSMFLLSNWTRHVKACKMLTSKPLKCMSLDKILFKKIVYSIL